MTPMPPRQTLATTSLAVAAGALVLLFGSGLGRDDAAPAQAMVAARRTAQPAAQRRAEALQAFGEVARVLRHPRCLNCHTVTSFPRQGDDRHPHANLVRRGPADRGVPGMTCGTCHQAANNPSSGVPGRPDWHLAPLTMGWEGLTDAELCRALKDPRRNGGRDLAALTRHVGQDRLVAYGWDPGGSRAPVPVPRAEVVRLMTAWADAGAPCASLSARH